MKITEKKLNRYMMFKLPSAYFCGVRLKSLSDNSAIVKVKHRWINQNPFNSLYFAVQSMAAEFSTGVLVIKKIDESGHNISMLITNHSGEFTKKATGIISFVCNEGKLIDEAIEQTINTGEGQKFVLNSVGKDETGDIVSAYKFEWSIKLKNKKL